MVRVYREVFKGAIHLIDLKWSHDATQVNCRPIQLGQNPQATVTQDQALQALLQQAMEAHQEATR